MSIVALQLWYRYKKRADRAGMLEEYFMMMTLTLF